MLCPICQRTMLEEFKTLDQVDQICRLDPTHSFIKRLNNLQQCESIKLKMIENEKTYFLKLNLKNNTSQIWTLAGDPKPLCIFNTKFDFANPSKLLSKIKTYLMFS